MPTRCWMGLLILGWTGCASDASSRTSPGAATNSDPSGTSTGQDTGSTTTSAPPLVAEYYAFQLAFDQRADDTWDPATAELTVRQYDADQVQLCSATVPILTVGPAAGPPNEPEVFEWWALGLDAAPIQTDCPDWGARTWTIGVGAYDTRLDAALAAEGHLGAELYGLYLQEGDGEPVYVLGYVADDAMLAGDTGLTVDVAPLPAGSYLAPSLLKMSVP